MLNYKNFQKVTFNNDGTELYTCAQICYEGSLLGLTSYCCQTDNCEPTLTTVNSCYEGFFLNNVGSAGVVPCKSPFNIFCQVIYNTNTLK